MVRRVNVSRPRSQTMAAFVLVLIFWSAVGAAVGYAIGNPRGRGEVGAVLGLFLGVLGWVIILLLPSTPEAEAARLLEVDSAARGAAPAGPLLGSASLRTCPWCAETIQSAAILCRFCGRDVDPIHTAALPADESTLETEARPDHPIQLEDGSLKCPYCKRTFVAEIDWTLTFRRFMHRSLQTGRQRSHSSSSLCRQWAVTTHATRVHELSSVPTA